MFYFLYNYSFIVFVLYLLLGWLNTFGSQIFTPYMIKHTLSITIFTFTYLHKHTLSITILHLHIYINIHCL